MFWLGTILVLLGVGILVLVAVYLVFLWALDEAEKLERAWDHDLSDG